METRTDTEIMLSILDLMEQQSKQMDRLIELLEAFNSQNDELERTAYL